MKHLRLLAYNVVQFKLKEYLILSFLFSGVTWAITGWWWTVPAIFAAYFIENLIHEHRKYKSTGKY